MRDHDDETVACDLGEQVHDLHAGLGVEGAGGLVGEQDFRVVDEGAGDGDALHLAARELAGLFVDVIGQSDGGEGLFRATAALVARDARKRERELDVGEHCLVRDEVVALEDEADAVVAVGVPVAVLVAFRGDAVDDEITRVVVIEPPMMLSKVVLPEPEGPRMATNSLSRNDTDTSSSAVCVKSPVV